MVWSINVAEAVDGNNTQAVFKNCAPFTDSVTEVNNPQVDNTEDLDIASECIIW